MKRLVPLVFAILMASLATFFAHQWVRQQRRALESERKELAGEREKVKAQYQTPIEVVVASKDLAEGTTLEPSHVKMATIPERFVQPYAVRAPREVVGKVAAAPIAEGEQVLLNKVRRPEELTASGSAISKLMPQGKRAVTIAVDTLTGVGGFVRPGDIVDILWTLTLPAAGQGAGQVVTLTVFQNVPVFAIGSEITGRSTESKGPKSEGGLQQYLVTLALSPQETAFLLFAREQGRLELSLRPKSENEARVAVAPANMNTLLEAQLGIKPTEAPPSGRASRQVEIYRGLKREIVALSGEE